MGHCRTLYRRPTVRESTTKCAFDGVLGLQLQPAERGDILQIERIARLGEPADGGEAKERAAGCVAAG